jgi:hypothetical protein
MLVRRSCAPIALSAATLLVAAVGVDGGQVAIAQSDGAGVAVERADTPAYDFTAADHEFLEIVQRGCFHYLWNEVGVPSGMAKDRRTTMVASLAGVGFQLSALPIAVERKWITEDQGRARALSILKTLVGEENRRDGVFLHFVHVDTGRLYPPYRNEISTVDHALFLAGAIPAAAYFGGEVAGIVDRLAAATNWKAFQMEGSPFLSMAWKPDDPTSLAGSGGLMAAKWRIASGEEHLVYFLAAGSPTPEFTVEPAAYYQLERQLGQWRSDPPYVLSHNGALFTYFFSHCWINYRDLAADDPQQFGVDAPRVDWFENSRRATLAHRDACVALAPRYKTFAEDRWGLSPCMGQDGDEPGWNYIVPSIRPNLADEEQLWHGTIAPYAAASAIMFTPAESLNALRAFREVRDEQGRPLVWRDSTAGGYAFADSFNLDQQVACDDNIAIDVGPMLLAIENARTGLIWRLFMEHPHAKRAVERLKFVPREDGE